MSVSSKRKSVVFSCRSPSIPVATTCDDWLRCQIAREFVTARFNSCYRILGTILRRKRKKIGDFSLQVRKGTEFGKHGDYLSSGFAPYMRELIRV